MRRLQSTIRLAAKVAVLTCLHSGAARSQAAVSLGCSLSPGPSRAVAAVIDAETLRLDDGVEVRLLGILAPRGADAGAAASAGNWPPEAIARSALHELTAGRSVALAFAGPRSDRYGRVLAHLFMTEAGGDLWVEGRLVEQGLVRAHTLPDSDSCMEELAKRERQARAGRLGLWAHAAYQVRPADRPAELQLYRHTYQLVRGRIERARRTSGLIILELLSSEHPEAASAASQGGAFRVVWRRDLGARIGLGGAEQWVGRNVLVRGWIESRRGPEIELVGRAQLELDE